MLLGKAGNDSLTGNDGDDMLRGQAGDDFLRGNAGRDILIGGTGADRFMFAFASHSPAGAGRDEIRAGDGAVAFQGAGGAAGDLIDIKAVDANTTLSGDQTFVFGSTGKGGLSLVDFDGNTLVRGNIDNSAAFEFEILIVDGAINASAYTAADFVCNPGGPATQSGRSSGAGRRSSARRSFGRLVLDKPARACGRPDHPPNGEKLVLERMIGHHERRNPAGCAAEDRKSGFAQAQGEAVRRQDHDEARQRRRSDREPRSFPRPRRAPSSSCRSRGGRTAAPRTSAAAPSRARWPPPR